MKRIKCVAIAFLLDHFDCKWRFDNEGSDGLAVLGILHADYTDVAYESVGEKTIFDLEGMDVFSAADDKIFDSSGDGYVAFLSDRRFVSCLITEFSGTQW